MKKSKVAGLVMLFIGAFVIYWAQTHSPNAGIGQVVGNAISGSYTMSENAYYISLIAGIAIGAYGVFKLVTGK